MAKYSDPQSRIVLEIEPVADDEDRGARRYQQRGANSTDQLWGELVSARRAGFMTRRLI